MRIKKECDDDFVCRNPVTGRMRCNILNKKNLNINELDEVMM